MATNGEACGLSLFCARRRCYRRRVCPGYRPFRRRFRRSGWPDVSRRVPSRSCGSHTRKARRSGGRSTRTRPRWTSRCWPALDGERLYRVARIERVDALVGGMLDGGRHRHRGLRAKRPVALSFSLPIGRRSGRRPIAVRPPASVSRSSGCSGSTRAGTVSPASKGAFSGWPSNAATTPSRGRRRCRTSRARCGSPHQALSERLHRAHATMLGNTVMFGHDGGGGECRR